MEEPTTITEESDDQSSVKSDDSCGSSSNRVKFLCSYGGRILPRPGDGKLRYAGGDTRVVAASRSISFAGLLNCFDLKTCDLMRVSVCFY